MLVEQFLCPMMMMIMVRLRLFTEGCRPEGPFPTYLWFYDMTMKFFWIVYEPGYGFPIHPSYHPVHRRPHQRRRDTESVEG